MSERITTPWTPASPTVTPRIFSAGPGSIAGSVVLPAIALLFFSTTAAAQSPPAPVDLATNAVTNSAANSPAAAASPSTERADPVPVYTVTRGGISMGSYMAGVNWVIVELIALSNDPVFQQTFAASRHVLRGSAGASAGNINSILTAITYCSPGRRFERPESSIFWKIWVNTGIEQLLPDQRRRYRTAQNKGLFHLDYYFGGNELGINVGLPNHLQTLQDAMSEPGLQDSPADFPGRDCLYPIGITLTPSENQQDMLSGIEIPFKRSVTLLAVEARDNRLVFSRLPRNPESTNYLSPRLEYGDAVEPPADSEGIILPRDVVSISAAGSAFPVAFSPVELDLIRPNNSTSCRHQLHCDESLSNRFLDGGVFDNRPVGTAYQFFKADHMGDTDYDWALHLDETIDKYDSDPSGDTDRVETSRIVFVAPNLPRDRRARLIAHQQNRRSIDDISTVPPGLNAMKKLATSFIPAARYYEFNAFLRQIGIQNEQVFGPSVEDRVFRNTFSTTTRSRPIVGAHLMAFGSFLGRPFREYDFYVGLYDGLQWFVRNVPFQIPESGTGADVARTAPEVREKVVALVRYLDSNRRGGMTNASLTILQELLRRDYDVDSTLATLIDASRTDGNDARSIEERHASLLLAVSRAVETVSLRKLEQLPTTCSPTNWLEGALCEDGILDIARLTKSSLAEIEGDDADGILKELAAYEQVDGDLRKVDTDGDFAQISPAMSNLERLNPMHRNLEGCITRTGYPYSYPCVVGNSFLELLDNPLKQSVVLFESILQQAWRIENIRTAAGRQSMESVVEAIMASYRFNVDIPTRSIFTTSTSLPRAQYSPYANMLRVLPYHFSWGSELFPVGEKGACAEATARCLSYYYSVGYRLSFGGLNKPIVVEADGMLFTNPTRVGYHAALGYQWHFDSIFLSGLSVNPAGVLYDRELGRAWVPSVTGYLLLNRAKVFVRGLPSGDPYHRLELGFGITDLLGTVYWVARRSR